MENVSNLKRAASHPVEARCICSGVVVRVALQGAKVGERDMTADAVVCTGIEEGWVVLLADLAELAGTTRMEHTARRLRGNTRADQRPGIAGLRHRWNSIEPIQHAVKSATMP
ncbi:MULTISPECIES: hypothetical protein [Paraburkholderia]|uniref:hypothetical protein n=1 Tax=Paraburkholderia sp. CHISQ3 TaxID=2937435 RepID=UPI00225873FC|nr:MULTISPECIES: hypothetical protein [Paraburkholderia]MCX4161109.1 hypothetical protein [Paraburkholderia megapolitana]MDN7156605.1 hypothetical protein [Paraburkholderia sp. CHISQ3]MDQ6493650.1 hypothetical protein [Paraburkholderia megapolitana]